MKQVQTPSSSRRTQCSRRDVPPGYKVHLQSWIGGWYVSHRQAKLATNNIAALCDGGRLVERYLAVAALTPKATVARHNQALGRNVLQRFADVRRHVLRPICLHGTMADGTYADLFLEFVLERLKQFQF